MTGTTSRVGDETSAVKLYTSRYQARSLILASGAVPVGITVGTPRFKTGYKYRMLKDLAPDRWMLQAPEEEQIAQFALSIDITIFRSFAVPD